MSGHSKWSTIKRKKGLLDAKRGKIFTKILKEVTVAARAGGGDPNGNARLRRAMVTAKAANVPADNLTRAIKKGTGELEGINYEELLYEGIGPAGAMFICEVLTDNRNRSAAEVRKLFDKGNGQLGASGSATWAFEQKGLVRIPAGDHTEESLFELAVGAGAEDLAQIGEEWSVTTARESLDSVRDAIEKAGVAIAESHLAYVPNNIKTVDAPEASQLMGLFDALDDHDDIQHVFTDFELSEAALAEMSD